MKPASSSSERCISRPFSSFWISLLYSNKILATEYGGKKTYHLTIESKDSSSLEAKVLSESKSWKNRSAISLFKVEILLKAISLDEALYFIRCAIWFLRAFFWEPNFAAKLISLSCQCEKLHMEHNAYGWTHLRTGSISASISVLRFIVQLLMKISPTCSVCMSQEFPDGWKFLFI